MKILFLHNQYKIRGGEDSVLENEVELLRERGHSAETFIVSNDGIVSTMDAVKIALHVNYSEKYRQLIAHKILEFKPTIVHVHNFFPQLTPSIYDACKDLNIPVVQTLHNFRIICANGIFLRSGKICEKCLFGSPYQAALYACYRNSHVQSLPVAKMISTNRKKNTWNEKVNRFIALSDFSRRKFIEAGIKSKKIAVKPNFLKDPIKENFDFSKKENFAVFVGRLSEEKGLHTLLRAWDTIPFPLKIIGDGPLSESLKTYNNKNVFFLGKKSRDEVYQELKKAAFLILPSECYENFPLSIAEAYAHGCPVLCTGIGSMNELVENDVTGYKFALKNIDDLKSKINLLLTNPTLRIQLGKNARQKYLAEFTPEKNYQQLMEIYQTL